MKSRSLIGVILGFLIIVMVITGCGKKESIQKKVMMKGLGLRRNFTISNCQKMNLFQLFVCMKMKCILWFIEKIQIQKTDL